MRRKATKINEDQMIREWKENNVISERGCYEETWSLGILYLPGHKQRTEGKEFSQSLKIVGQEAVAWSLGKEK